MAGLKIGRQPLDILTNVESVRHTPNDTVEFNGRFNAATLADAKLMRDHFRALVASERDEDHVPIVWDTDPTYDGFVEVTAASVDIEPAQLVDGSGGKFRWNLTVRYLPGRNLALAESILLSHTRPNEWGIVTTVSAAGRGHFHAVPASVAMYDISWPHVPLGPTPTESGALAAVSNPGSDTVGAIGHHRARYQLAPADWWVGAPTLSIGSPLKIAAYRHIDPSELAAGWQLSNGIIRIVADNTVNAPAGGSDPDQKTLLRIDRWDPTSSSWKTGYRCALFAPTPLWVGPGQAHLVTGMTVLRSTPAVTAIRVYMRHPDPGPPPNVHTLDITLRRGADHADFTWAETSTATILGGNAMRLEIQNPDAANEAAVGYTEVTPTGTFATAGWQRSNPNPDGNYWVFATPKAFNRTTGQPSFVVQPDSLAGNTIQRTWAFSIGVTRTTGAPWPTAATRHFFQTVERTRIIGA